MNEVSETARDRRLREFTEMSSRRHLIDVRKSKRGFRSLES